jgi:hypothetical protein
MSQPIILIKRVRDRKAWLRELGGLFSDALDWLLAAKEAVRELGRWSLRELGQ